ncbi:MAG: phosphotransferase [Candidatus Pacearchaeota archaeon]|nr:MAG: phosphotransferase [Candidatus Pacearchaeota archaeon]
MKPTKKELSAWKLKNPKIIKRFTEGVENESYLIYDGDKKYVFRRIKEGWNIGIPKMKKDDIFKVLEKLSVESVPRPTRTKKKELINPTKPRRTALLEYIPGRTFKKRFPNLREIELIADSHSGLTKNLKKIKPISKFDNPRIFLSKEELNKIRRHKQINHKLTLQAYNFVKFEYKKINWVKLKKQIVHNDIQKENAIIFNKRIGIIDFDDLAYGYVAYDLSKALLSLCITKKFDTKKASRYLEIYQKRIRLNNEEKKALLILMITWVLWKIKESLLEKSEELPSLKNTMKELRALMKLKSKICL